MRGNNHEHTGLYDPSYEHDSCGIGFVANINGTKSRSIVSDAITMLENMEHRGIILQIKESMMYCAVIPLEFLSPIPRASFSVIIILPIHCRAAAWDTFEQPRRTKIPTQEPSRWMYLQYLRKESNQLKSVVSCTL